MQNTAREMLERNNIPYEEHNHNWGFYIGDKYFTPAETINAIIDETLPV